MTHNIIRSSFDSRVFNFQDFIIENAKSTIRNFLVDSRDNDQFRESVDWLLSSDANSYFELYKDVSAIEAIKHILYEFSNRCDEDPDTYAEIDIYDAICYWFEIED
jgi:hypothetical protein